MFRLLILSLALAVFPALPTPAADAQDSKNKPAANAGKPKQKKQPGPFRWVNPLKQELPGVKHATFRSPSMKIDVGYCLCVCPKQVKVMLDKMLGTKSLQ